MPSNKSTKPSFYNTLEFKKLNEEWSRRLEESGFRDEEVYASGDYHLKDFHVHKFSRNRAHNRYGKDYNAGSTAHAPVQEAASRTEYFRSAGHFLYEYEFGNKLDRTVWQMHSEGLTDLEIREMLLSLLGVTKARSQINVIVNRLRGEMNRWLEQRHESE